MRYTFNVSQERNLLLSERDKCSYLFLHGWLKSLKLPPKASPSSTVCGRWILSVSGKNTEARAPATDNVPIMMRGSTLLYTAWKCVTKRNSLILPLLQLKQLHLVLCSRWNWSISYNKCSVSFWYMNICGGLKETWNWYLKCELSYRQLPMCMGKNLSWDIYSYLVGQIFLHFINLKFNYCVHHVYLLTWLSPHALCKIHFNTVVLSVSRLLSGLLHGGFWLKLLSNCDLFLVCISVKVEKLMWMLVEIQMYWHI